jgi:hypothetical protein
MGHRHHPLPLQAPADPEAKDAAIEAWRSSPSGERMGGTVMTKREARVIAMRARVASRSTGHRKDRTIWKKAAKLRGQIQGH